LSDFDATPTELLEMPMASEEITEEYITHVRKINDIFYDQIKISDQKAAYIFTFMLAFLVSSSDGRQVFNFARYLTGTWFSNFASAALAVASIFSILAAILVVLPRHVEKSTSLFWGTWPRHRPIFESAARNRDVAYLFHEYLENADVLSLIARQKYKFVGYAFRGLVFTVLAYVLLLVANQAQG
jgi:hypothetical protein